VELCSVQLRNGHLRFVRVRHFDKSESTRLAGFPVGHDAYTLYAAVSGERIVKLILGGLITEISDKNVGHSVDPLKYKLSLSDCAANQT